MISYINGESNKLSLLFIDGGDINSEKSDEILSFEFGNSSLFELTIH